MSDEYVDYRHPNRSEIAAVLSDIHALDLPYPSGSILSAFISEALEPLDAARYVTERLSTDDPQTIVSDWTYIVRCSKLVLSTLHDSLFNDAFYQLWMVNCLHSRT
jgi:hypothetical protein